MNSINSLNSTRTFEKTQMCCVDLKCLAVNIVKIHFCSIIIQYSLKRSEHFVLAIGKNYKVYLKNIWNAKKEYFLSKKSFTPKMLNADFLS